MFWNAKNPNRLCPVPDRKNSPVIHPLKYGNNQTERKIAMKDEQKYRVIKLGNYYVSGYTGLGRYPKLTFDLSYASRYGMEKDSGVHFDADKVGGKVFVVTLSCEEEKFVSHVKRDCENG